MKIKTLGARGYTCQVNRIDEGFRLLGHEVVKNGERDVTYCNNQSLICNDEKSYKIYNVLDVPEHLLEREPNILDNIKQYIDGADQITCISNFVKKQLKHYFNVDAKVIYNPVKDVRYEPSIKKEFNFLYVGRATDKNKRFELAVNDVCGLLRNNIKLVGQPVGFHFPNKSWGNIENLGSVDDSTLNLLYNKARFLLLPSKLEGIGLPMIEAMICGTIPILCSDNETAYEFAPDWCITDPDEGSIKELIYNITGDYDSYRDIILNEYSDKLYYQFNKVSIAKNITNLFNDK